MLATNGERPASATTENGARIDLGAGKHPLSSRNSKDAQVHRLHHGRARTPIVEIIPDDDLPAMFRIAWPDIGLSPPANLSRCCDAARSWAETQILKDERKNSAARCLKSLDNFSWSSRSIEANAKKVTRAQKTHSTQSGEARP